jgi:hypothetical protein
VLMGMPMIWKGALASRPSRIGCATYDGFQVATFKSITAGQQVTSIAFARMLKNYAGVWCGRHRSFFSLEGEERASKFLPD